MVPNSTENRLKIIGIVCAVLFLADLAVVNLKVFSSSQSQTPPVPTVLPTPSLEAQGDCPAACRALIPPITTGSVTEAISRPTTQPATIAQPLAKEIYIPLGNGSTKSQEWVEIPGAEAVLDTANFPKIKSMIFEAFLRIPTGNGRAYAKLYNVTDKHDVWFSEVMVEGGNTQRVESKNIGLDAGRKVYRVMMKTAMGYEAVLESARLKIILE